MNYSPFAIGISTAVGLLVASFALRRRREMRTVVPVWLAMGAIGFFTGGSLGIGAMYSLGYHVTPRVAYHGTGRGIGQRPPVLPRKGWLNNQAASWAELRGRIVVVDIWADW